MSRQCYPSFENSVIHNLLVPKINEKNKNKIHICTLLLYQFNQFARIFILIKNKCSNSDSINCFVFHTRKNNVICFILVINPKIILDFINFGFEMKNIPIDTFLNGRNSFKYFFIEAFSY